ncbi:MAG: LytR/AlgR family response regulator transcription factor, partial [Myxococcota bacterium]
MTALRVVTVDDEPLARERVSTLVRETAGLELVGEGTNGLEALDLITALEPDVVFIDIEMPELDGFGVISALVERCDAGQVPAIVFVTAHDEYALRAFDAHAVDYLLKPFSDERFQASLDRAIWHLRAGQAHAMLA